MRMLQHSDLPSEAFCCGLHVVHMHWGQDGPWILKAYREIRGGSAGAGQGRTVVCRQLLVQ